MDLSLLFWIEAVVAFFLGLLCLLDFRKYRESIFKYLYMVFFLIVLKSVFFYFSQFGNVFWIKEEIGFTGNLADVLFKDLIPRYNLMLFIWQVVDFILIVVISYLFILRRKQVETDNVKGIKFSMWLQIILAIVIALPVVITSLQSKEGIDLVYEKIEGKKFVVVQEAREGVTEIKPQKVEIGKDFKLVEEPSITGEKVIRMKTTVRTMRANNELFEQLKVIGKYVFLVWKFVLLIIAWTRISSIYGYIANLLNYISKRKGLLYLFLGVEMVFNLFSGFVMINANMAWIGIELFALLLFATFGYAVHTQYISDIEEMVDNLARERDIIIDLMRDISSIIGAGDFELDTIVKEIVDASVKGATARAGTILIKDPLTNRLNVKYVNGLYPPTRPFKIVQGMTLNEAVIVEKLRSEKIAVGEGLIGQVADNGESIYIPDTMKDERFIQTIKGTMTVSSFIAVPLKTKDDVFGVLSIVDDERSFLESDLGLIETLGEQAAITIKQIQMYQEILEKKQAEKELGVAGEIQSSLIPHAFPESDKYDMFAFSIPAKGVGGDYYDYIDFGSNKLAVTMFDVSGKGVPAALIMVMIRSILRTIASLDEETNEVLNKLNNTISEEIVEDRYATGFYLLFDAERGIMSYTNAGHGPLVLYRSARDEFEFMDTDGMPVGIMSGIEYGKGYTTLEKGDIAILYTDGITEAMNNSHEEFGMERLHAAVREVKREPARGIANKILEEVNRFVAGAPQHDDETLLVLKMK